MAVVTGHLSGEITGSSLSQTSLPNVRSVRDYYDLTELGRARRLRALVMIALDHYDLELVSLRLITNETNGVFRADAADGTRYVVRVGLGGEVGHATDVVRAEVAWLAAISNETDLLVPEPIRTRSGSRVVVDEAPGVPERRNVVVFSWISGPLLGDRLTPQNVEYCGAYVAALHNHGAGFVPPYAAALPRYDRALPFEEADHLARLDDSQLARAGRERFGEARARVDEAIVALRGAVPMQLLHGDFHPWNVKVQRSRIAAFDFEDLMWGWPIQDVATTLYYLHGDPDYQALANAFAEGYRSVAPWPAADQSDIDTFVMGRALVLANYVLASAELRDRSAYWLRRFDRRISALLEGINYVPLRDSQ